MPFGQRAAQHLLAIGRCELLSNANHGSHLPPSWRTLYELTRLNDLPEIKRCIAEHEQRAEAA